MSHSIASPRSTYGTCATPQGSYSAVLVAAMLLVVAVGLVFVQTGRHQFVNFDDDRYVYDNSHITSGINLRSIAWVFYSRHSHNWHPLTGLSHLIDWQVYRGRAGGHHLTSVLCHAVTVVLLMLVLRRLTGRLWPSVCTAALFAIHPLRVESVAWVAERKDVLSGMFFMLTLYAYACYVRGRGDRSGPNPTYYPLVIVFYICGLMSKPMLVTVPFVLLLLDYWPLRRITFDRSWGTSEAELVGPEYTEGNLEYPNLYADAAADHLPLSTNPATITHDQAIIDLVIEKIPLLVLAAVSCGLTLFVQTDAMQSVDRVSLVSRLCNAMIAYADYLGVFFCPRRLAVLYPHPTTEIDIKIAVLCGTGVVLITIVALLLARRWPVLLVGWLWYLGMLIPVIGLVQVGGAAMADRYTYLPQIGVAMALVWTADAFIVKLRLKPLAVITASFMVALLIVCAWRQTTFWRNSESLWMRDLSMYGARNAVANYNLGMTLAEQGRNEEAVAYYRRALQASPDDQDTYINLGLAQAALGRYAAATDSYARAIKLDSTTWQAHKNLGVVLHDQGNMAETVRQWRLAIELRLGQDHEEMPDLLWSTAFILASTPNEKLRDPVEALKLAERGAKATQYTDPVVLDALAVACAAAGRFPEAIQYDQKALTLLQLRTSPDESLMADIRKRIALFEQGKPFRTDK